ICRKTRGTPMDAGFGRKLLAATLVCHAAAVGAANGQAAVNSVALENDYVRVSQNAAPCAAAASGTCEDRVIIAMDDISLKAGGSVRQMKYGQIAIFKAGESYEPPAGGAYFEVAVKPNHPPVK